MRYVIRIKSNNPRLNPSEYRTPKPGAPASEPDSVTRSTFLRCGSLTLSEMTLDCTSSGFAATVIFSLSGASMTGKPSNSVFGITHSQQGQQPKGRPGQYTTRRKRGGSSRPQ